MSPTSIDSALVASADLEADSDSYRRLGLTIGSVSGGQRSLRIGGFALYLMTAAGEPLGRPLAAARNARPGLFAVTLAVPNLARTVERLSKRGVPVDATTRVAYLPIQDRAGLDVALVEQADPLPPPNQRFPLRRLDHLAAIAHDLEGKCQFWKEELDVPVAGEVVTPTMVVRQLRIGDAVLELLGPASPESPIHQRPAGLLSMASWEVDDLEDAVRRARQAGFTPSDPAAGPLPGTRISTIPGTEIGGVNMQLLQRVGGPGG